MKMKLRFSRKTFDDDSLIVEVTLYDIHSSTILVVMVCGEQTIEAVI